MLHRPLIQSLKHATEGGLLKRSQHFIVRSLSSSIQPLRSPKDHDVAFFQSLLSDHGVVQDADVLQASNTDWTKHYQGQSSIILKPHSTKQVSEILRYCQQEGIGIVPQAGNTGLVGGSVPVNKEIILSTEKLNTIHHLDEFSGILKCQAGCILQDLQDYCAERQHLVPVDLGSKGTCQIGGNISTNAGGVYYYRYGSLAGNLLGLEVVLADGRVLDLNYSRSNLKDNTGYKLHQLFLGAEGTLGIVTGVALLCPRLPLSRQAVFLACQTYEDVLAVLQTAKTRLGEILAALEWMDDNVVKLVGEHHTIPIAGSNGSPYPYYLLVETHGSNMEHDQAKMQDFLESTMGNGHVVDGVLAQDLTQVQAFWKIRESTNPIVGSLGYGYKYDLSLPISEFDDFIRTMQERLQGWNVINTNWGHVLDGNLHFNVTTPNIFKKDAAVLNRLEPFVLEQVLQRGGSISAEHGIGQLKRDKLFMVHKEATLDVMQRLKRMLDPTGILNPNKYLP